MLVKNALLGLALLLGSVAGDAHAATLTFSAQLSGEAPGSSGSGTALISFDDATSLMTVNATFSGLSGTTNVAHIHCCVAPQGTAGVATTVPTFPGFPTGVTSGSYSQVFDMTLAASFNPSFITNNGGTAATALAALLAGMDSGWAYFNIHTTTFTGGEIRGFISPVPIPTALPLLASSLGALGIIGWRRKRKLAQA